MSTVVMVKEELKGKIGDDILVMLGAGVFEFKSGKAIIHRDSDGIIRKIDMELVKYSKGK